MSRILFGFGDEDIAELTVDMTGLFSLVAYIVSPETLVVEMTGTFSLSATLVAPPITAVPQALVMQG